MSDIKVLADMNISPQTVSVLQQQGWDIIRVPEVLPATASDLEILDFARQENRVIVTQDLDFSMLIAVGGYDQPSLITLRLSIADPTIVSEKLLKLLPQLKNQLQEGCAVTVADDTVRIRRLPI